MAKTPRPHTTTTPRAVDQVAAALHKLRATSGPPTEGMYQSRVIPAIQADDALNVQAEEGYHPLAVQFILDEIGQPVGLAVVFAHCTSPVWVNQHTITHLDAPDADPPGAD
jgi:hypothetical protein